MEIFDTNNEKYSVSQRWKDQYFRSNQWLKTMGKEGYRSAEYIYNDILIAEQIQGPGKYDAIDQAIGNTSWTSHHCDCCGILTREPMITFDYDGGEHSIEMCKKCLMKGARKLRRYGKK